MTKRIGIVGAGKVGIVLAQRARAAGYEVYISGSGSAEKIALTISVLTPGAHAVTTAELASACDMIVLAVPLSKFRRISSTQFDGKLVIDAMNYWWEVDGLREDIIPEGISSSEAVQQYFSGARVVKGFSHMGYHELHDMPNMTPRKAIAIAGNQEDVETVAVLVNEFGFDPLAIGDLAKGRVLEPGEPGFGVALEKAALGQKLIV